MKTQHTPGPWHHEHYGHICAGPNVIGEVYKFELNDKQRDEYLPWEANAELIAAAPELLDTLRELYAGLVMEGVACYGAMKKAKTLIDKLPAE